MLESTFKLKNWQIRIGNVVFMIELFLYTAKVLAGSLKNASEFFRCFTKFQGFSLCQWLIMMKLLF